jgi:hypothetical protein
MADLEGRGIPTVGVATTEFIEGAAAQAKSLGIDLKISRSDVDWVISQAG